MNKEEGRGGGGEFNHRGGRDAIKDLRACEVKDVFNGFELKEPTPIYRILFIVIHTV